MSGVESVRIACCAALALLGFLSGFVCQPACLAVHLMLQPACTLGHVSFGPAAGVTGLHAHGIWVTCDSYRDCMVVK